MKTIFLSITILLISATAFAITKFESQMVESIPTIYQASIEQLDALTNKFQRIGDAEKDKWEPYYYASLSQVFKFFQTRDKSQKDLVIDRSLAFLETASNLDPANSEIEALRGFALMMKMTVDPANRGRTMSPAVFAALGKAMGLNPGNPRAVLFIGQMKMGMAEHFGESTDEACQLIHKANDLFSGQEVINPIAPSWGSHGMDHWLGKCN